jgi:hypothetical protein
MQKILMIQRFLPGRLKAILEKRFQRRLAENHERQISKDGG